MKFAPRLGCMAFRGGEDDDLPYLISYASGGAGRDDFDVLDGGYQAVRDARILDTTPDGGGRRFRGPLYGREVDPDSVPRRVRALRRYRRLPDWNYVAVSCLLVFDQIRRFVEQFESDFHQFIPVEVSFKDGRTAPPNFWIVPCVRLDVLHRGLTVPPVDEEKNLWVPPGQGECRLVHDAAAIDDSHMWEDKSTRKKWSIFSNLLAGSDEDGRRFSPNEVQQFGRSLTHNARPEIQLRIQSRIFNGPASRTGRHRPEIGRHCQPPIAARCLLPPAGVQVTIARRTVGQGGS